MLKAAEGERKIREINLFIDIQIDLSVCKNSNHYFSRSMQLLSWHSLGAKNVSMVDKCSKGKQITAAENMWKKLHRVYPAEIIQTSSLGRLQKKLLEHNECLYIASVLLRRVRKPPTDNIPSPQNYFQTNC